MLISNGTNTREWNIFLISDDGSVEEVEHLFDANGNETFDPTEATEVSFGGELVQLEAGDTLQFELIAD